MWSRHCVCHLSGRQFSFELCDVGFPSCLPSVFDSKSSAQFLLLTGARDPG